MDIAYIKSLAKSLFIEEIKETPKEIRFKFASDFKEYNNIYKVLLKYFKENVVLYFGENPCFAIKLNTIKKEDALKIYREILLKIIENS